MRRTVPSLSPPPRPCRGKTRRPATTAAAAWFVLVWLGNGPGHASDLISLSEATDRVLVELVTVAYHYDLYIERCRGAGVSRKLADVNDVLYPKYRVLADDIMLRYIAQTRLAAEEKLRADYFAKLEALGGCARAEEADFEQTLAARYRDLLKRVREQP